MSFLYLVMESLFPTKKEKKRKEEKKNYEKCCYEANKEKVREQQKLYRLKKKKNESM